MSEKNQALRRRIAPFIPLTLELEEPGGGNVKIELKLAFNMNAGVAIQESTRAPHRPDGLLLTSLGRDGVWGHLREPLVQRATLWAASLAHQPEYETDDDEGLKTIGSYLQEKDSDAIAEALWKAYMAYLSPKKREYMEKLKAEAEAAQQGDKSKNDDPPAATPATPGSSESTGSSSGPSPAPSDSALTNSAS